MSDLIKRIKVLATGRVSWCDPHTGEVESDEKLSWRDRWAVFGIHSYNWWWVKRFGALDCGCTRNPVTRRVVLIRWRCPEHCSIDPSDAALLDQP